MQSAVVKIDFRLKYRQIYSAVQSKVVKIDNSIISENDLECVDLFHKSKFLDIAQNLQYFNSNTVKYVTMQVILFDLGSLLHSARRE